MSWTGTCTACLNYVIRFNVLYHMSYIPAWNRKKTPCFLINMDMINVLYTSIYRKFISASGWKYRSLYSKNQYPFSKRTHFSLSTSLLSKSRFSLVTETNKCILARHFSWAMAFLHCLFLYFYSRMFPSRLQKTGMLFHFL